MGGSVRDSVKAISPKFLQGTVGEKFLYVFGFACDMVLDKLNQAMRMHIPTYGDPSGLATIGADRLIPQGASEAPSSYAQRLKFAYDDWAIAGSARAMMRQLLGYVSPSTPLMRIVGNGTGNATPWDSYLSGVNPTTTAPSHALVLPANWNWDGNTSQWWRAWIIIDCSSGAPFTTPKWGDGHKWGDGTWWGFKGTSVASASSTIAPEVASLQAIIALWKPANINVVNIILSFDATLFDPSLAFGSPKLPDGKWGSYYELSGTNAVPSRSPNASYLPGVS